MAERICWEVATAVAIALAEPAVDHVLLVARMKSVFTLIFCLMASCVGLQPRAASVLLGEWRYADKIQSCQYVFNRDGSFSGEVTYHGKLISKFTGRWTVDGDNLLYRYINDSFDRIPAGATDRDQLLSVQSDFFVIQAKDGSRRKYLRVR